MISVDEAFNIVLSSAKQKPPVFCAAGLSAGYVLAEDIISPENIPDFDNSAVDGYAVRTDDVAGASEKSGISLRVIDTIHAGEVSKKSVQPGTAIRIMTGACLPKGADTVVMVEKTKHDGENVTFNGSAVEGENCRKKGDDIRKGDRVFSKGHVLRPYDLGVLASIGRLKVRVFAKPTVAILATGDELVLPGKRLTFGKIRASSGVALSARLQELGYDVKDIGIARDTPADTRAKLKKAFRADVIFTTGGVSMGEKDYVREALEDLGVKILFWKVKQKPGKPLVFGTAGKKLFFGLPGNPVSSLICFELYGVPVLKKLSGNDTPSPKIHIQVGQTIRKNPGLRHFFRAKLVQKDGRPVAMLTGNQSSGVLSSLSYADVLLDVPELQGDVGEGDSVEAYILNIEKYFSPR